MQPAISIWQRPSNIDVLGARNAHAQLERNAETTLPNCRAGYVTLEEKAAWETAALLHRYPRSRADLPRFIANAKLLMEAIFPPSHPVRQAVKAVIEGDADWAIIGGTPIGCPTAPPKTSERPNKDACSELFALGLVRAAGAWPMGLEQEQAGALVHQIAPQPGHENSSTHAGSIKQADHSDNPGIPWRYRQTHLTLHGLINERNVSTAFHPLDELLAKLSARDILRLQEPCVTFAMPRSFALADWLVRTPPQPILRSEQGVWHIGFHTAAAAPVPGFEDSYAAVMQAISDTEPVRLVVSPGDFLIWRDSRFLHGRDTTEGQRWVQRLYLRKSLESLRQACPGARFIFDVRRLIMAE